MLTLRPLLPALLLLAACGGADASDPGAANAPAPAPVVERELRLGSAADELIMDEEIASSSALASLGGLNRSAAAPAPKTSNERPASAPPSPPTVDAGLGVDGARSITPRQIKHVIDRNQAQVTACYERELKSSPGLRGKVVVGFVIGADGRVRPPRVVRNTTRNRDMLPCIKRAVRSWRFPTAEGPADVEYPFAFKPRDF